MCYTTDTRSGNPPLPIWKPFLPRHACRPEQRPWLMGLGSLTARLQARYPDFRVHLIFEGPCPPLPDEKKPTEGPLAMPRSTWVREVCLMHASRPLVFARSILAVKGLSGPWHCLRQLGTRPLGALLFTHPDIVRSPLSAACLTPLDARHRQAAQVLGEVVGPLWARRSCFARQAHPLLVTEVFLPTLWADLGLSLDCSLVRP
jgi:chorismate lyase